MKNFKNYFLVISSIIVLVISSCKKDDKLVVNPTGGASTLSASSTNIVLDKNRVNASDTSVLFTITKPNFGYNAAVINTIQIDSMGDNWRRPQSIVFSANATTRVFTTADLNSLLLRLNLPTTTNSQVLVRVVSTVGSNVATQTSNVLTLTVRPFNLAAYLWVPGAYQGWNPGSADSLVSPTGNGIYTGVINFTGSDLNFKLTPAKNWNTSYGLGTTAGTISLTGGNFLAPANGGLLLTVNTNNNTYTIVPQWSIIGDATPGGWGTDTNLFLDKTNNTWYITTTLLNDGTKQFKFRFANDWAINLGGSNGTLTQGGANITVPTSSLPGNSYRVTLNPTANTYTLIKQ